jgi:septum formation protein
MFAEGQPCSRVCYNGAMRKIILASASPRRKQLLEAMGVTFEIIPSNFDEQLDNGRSPAEVAKELGLGKAMTVAQANPDAVVVGSDAIVTIDGKQLGKPADLDDAREMLKLACSAPNLISSSIAVVCLAGNARMVDVGEATVFFKPYNRAAVEAYLSTGDYSDKAGAYGVQSGAAPLVDHIEGRFDVVLGMPTDLLASMLRKFGVMVEPAELSPPSELVFK